MKTIIWHESERVARWVCERVGGSYDPDSRAIGLEKDGKLIAGVLFDHYNGRSIAMHVASEGINWMTRDYAKACFGYPFNQLKVNKIIGIVDSTNLAAKRYDEKLGFVLSATIPDAGKQGDLLIYTMDRAQCRFLR